MQKECGSRRKFRIFLRSSHFCDGLFKFKKHKKCRKIVEKNILINHKNLKYYINNVNFSFVFKKYA